MIFDELCVSDKNYKHFSIFFFIKTISTRYYFDNFIVYICIKNLTYQNTSQANLEYEVFPNQCIYSTIIVKRSHVH